MITFELSFNMCCAVVNQSNGETTKIRMNDVKWPLLIIQDGWSKDNFARNDAFLEEARCNHRSEY